MISGPIPQGNFVPLAPEQEREVKNAVNGLLNAMIRVQETDRRLESAVRREQEAVRREQEAVCREQEAVRREQEAVRREQEAVRREQEAVLRKQKAVLQGKEIDCRVQKAQGEMVHLVSREAEVDRKLQEALAKEKNIIIKMFHGIFNGKKPLPVEEVDSLFSTYLADGSITVEMISEKNRLKLNSMKAIIRYLDDHPGVKACDFRSFRGEVHDVKTLADYLAQSSCTIKAIGIDRKISDEAQSSLAEVVKAKNGALKVQYFDN